MLLLAACDGTDPDGCVSPFISSAFDGDPCCRTESGLPCISLFGSVEIPFVSVSQGTPIPQAAAVDSGCAWDVSSRC
jgi:hypothetical protein